MEEDIKIIKLIMNETYSDMVNQDGKRIYKLSDRQRQAIENLIKGYKEHRNALIDMVDQFADTDKEEKHLYTMGLSALENAFSVLDIDEGIKREDLWKLQEGDK